MSSMMLLLMDPVMMLKMICPGSKHDDDVDAISSFFLMYEMSPMIALLEPFSFVMRSDLSRGWSSYRID
jgi:hypothetical protein